MKKFKTGDRVLIPSCAIEFNVGSNTIWIQGEGGTTLRIKCNGKINIDQCANSPISHSDIIVDGDINFCLSEDAVSPEDFKPALYTEDSAIQKAMEMYGNLIEHGNPNYENKK